MSRMNSVLRMDQDAAADSSEHAVSFIYKFFSFGTLHFESLFLIRLGDLTA